MEALAISWKVRHRFGCLGSTVHHLVSPCAKFHAIATEYAEAMLFYAWLFGSTTEVPEMTPATPPAKLLQQTEFTPVELEPVEYLGGLCDL